MASSGKSRRSRTSDLPAHVAQRLEHVVTRGDRLLLALSGGVDSVVLLDLLTRLQKRVGFTLRALHVNHQLSPNAGEWARFCRAVCRERGVPCRVARVTVQRRNSTERAARDARYAALRSAPADFILLAHNEDDQAETVLLQLLRGAGVKGLSAMPFLRDPDARAARPHASYLRPLLDVPRADIESYARAAGLRWISDESNADTDYLRNWLRHDILPVIARRVPGYRATLARTARHFAEAAALADDLAAIDAGDAARIGTIPLERLRALTPARAKNVLRYLIAARGGALPPALRLEEALRQALTAKSDAAVAVPLGVLELRRHAGAIHLVAPRAHARSARVTRWRGERSVILPELGGTLVMQNARGTGLSVARLESTTVTIRVRGGGEKIQVAANRPRRTLKNLLQEAAMPPWERERVPLIYCDGTLACVPGVAVDYRFQARKGERSVLPQWRR